MVRRCATMNKKHDARTRLMYQIFGGTRLNGEAYIVARPLLKIFTTAD